MIENKDQQIIEEVSWRAVSKNNADYWISHPQPVSTCRVVESVIRQKKLKNGHGYFEADAAFFSFRDGIVGKWFMRDYAYDFETVRMGLATLENAFFELSRGFSEYKNINESPVDVATILQDSTAVFDLELESMDRDLPGLWNSPTSRAVFLHIVQKSKTTGFLALAFDLLCRNTLKYLQVHKLLHTSPVAAAVPMARVTRRMNAWQQQQQLEGW